MAGSSRILTVRILSDASKVGIGLGAAEASYGKFAQALGTKSGTAGVAVGNSLVSGIDKALGAGLAVVGGAGALVLGTALTKGFQRLTAIDEATAKLAGLGHSAKTVETIMDNALSSVRGTAYGLGSAATVAAQVVAAGIQPGQQLESTLKLVADSATISGRSMEDMGAIWAKVAAKNKLQGDVINQLTDAGIPILQLLATHYGTTAEAASQMVSRGEVDFAAFASSMKAGMGGAALESGNTFTGAWENTLAALGRIGENLLSPLFQGAKDGLKGLPELLAPVEQWAKDAGQAIADMGVWISDNAGLVQGLGIAAGIAIAVLLGFRTVVAVMSAYKAVMAVVQAFQIGYTAATYGTAAASYAGAAGTIAQNVAMVAGKAVFLAVAAAQKIAAAAQWALNAAMSANPIALIIIAVIALVAAFIWLWNNVEGFRNFFIGVWDAIVAVATTVWNAIVAGASAAFSWISGAVSAVGDFFVGIWNFVVTAVSAYFQAWQIVISVVVGVIQTVIGAVADFFAAAWNTAVGIAKAVIQGFQTGVAAIINGIRSVVQGVADFFGNAWSGAVSIAQGVFNTFKSIVTNVFNAIMTPINAVKNAISAIFDVARNVGNAIGGFLGFGGRSALLPGLPAGIELMSRTTQHIVPLGTRTTRAPSLSGVLGAGIGGRGGDVTVINVSGGLDSADAIARRIQSLLDQRDRRAGGVVLTRRTS